MELWQFWTYSFLGYLLEKGYARFTRAGQQVRKCFFLLPLCPVYGLGVLAVLALPPGLTAGFWPMALWGGLTATAVEYGVHLFYDRLLHVRFWDYTGVWGSLHGRVCVPFTVLWGLLLALGLPAAQRMLTPLLAVIPPWATLAALVIFTADTVISFQILRRTGDPDALRLAMG